MQNLEILQKSKSIDILLALLEHGELGLYQLKEKTSGSASITSTRAPELIAAGLIKERREKSFQGRRLFSLTPKGRKVAEYLMKIKEYMNNHQ